MFAELTEPQQEQQRAMQARLRQAMHESGGALPFHRFMELALYAPEVGYYTGGSVKLGEAGDFVTAPEISPFFSRCLARQCAQILAQPGMAILEFGAGRGVMAAEILATLAEMDCLPQHYYILELSPQLRMRQARYLRWQVPELFSRVQWLERLPERFSGIMLANEVLDAMPVHRFRRMADEIQEQWVTWGQDEQLIGIWRPASARLRAAVMDLESRLGVFAQGYESEINLRLGPWLQNLAASLQRGCLLAIDYGYEEAEYYHPQRYMGTLIAHFRHQAHEAFLRLPGLQDITASVDFSALVREAEAVGLRCLGYESQARFLLNCGLDVLLSQLDPNAVDEYWPAMQKVKQLILPNEMGERFKAIALGRGLSQDLLGFAH